MTTKDLDKIIDLIEEEIKLASGNSKEHFSGECKMNEIIECIQKLAKSEYKQGQEEASIYWQQSIKKDINSVLNMIEGGESRDKIANYIIEYLL